MSVESCSSSMTCDMEEVCSESSRKMKDMEETTSEASWTTVKKGKTKEVWRLEPEGEAEKLEATGLWSEVKGVSVNPEGESGHRHARAKMERKERENETKMEKKVNGKVLWAEGAEVQSPKRKVIRVESEETQDSVRIVEPEPGGSRRTKFRAQRDQHPTKAHVLV